MKKLFVMALVLSMSLVFASCGGGKLGGSIKGETTKTEGWIDNDTFRVVAVGFPKKGITNLDQKKATASDAAQLVAEKKILEKFKGARIEGASGALDNESTGSAIAKEFGGFVKGGSVLSTTCNEEGTCEVLYEVHAKGLKKKVTASDIQ